MADRNVYDMLGFHHAASIVKTGVEVTRNVLKDSLGDDFTSNYSI